MSTPQALPLFCRGHKWTTFTPKRVDVHRDNMSTWSHIASPSQGAVHDDTITDESFVACAKAEVWDNVKPNPRRFPGNCSSQFSRSLPRLCKSRAKD